MYHIISNNPDSLRDFFELYKIALFDSLHAGTDWEVLLVRSGHS